MGGKLVLDFGKKIQFLCTWTTLHICWAWASLQRNDLNSKTSIEREREEEGWLGRREGKVGRQGERRKIIILVSEAP